MRAARAAAVAGVVLASLLGAAGPAVAADPTTATGVVVDQHDGQVLQAVRVTRIYPGASRQVVLFLEDGDAQRARRVQVGVSHLSDLQNSCIHPQGGTGDTSCGQGDDPGELSSHPDVRLAAGTTAGDHRACTPASEPAATSLPTLRSAPVVVGLPDDDGDLCVVATFTHVDTATDNLTQTDSVAFDLALRFDGDAVTSAGGAA